MVYIVYRLGYYIVLRGKRDYIFLIISFFVYLPQVSKILELELYATLNQYYT